MPCVNLIRLATLNRQGYIVFMALIKSFSDRFKILVTLLFFGMLVFPGNLSAWSYHTHRKITSDAMRLMPESFRKEFLSHKSHFLKGSTDPDTMIKDFTNHAYHPDGSHDAGLYRIQDLFNRAVELIRNRESSDKTAYVLGLMSHYIADLNQPLHTAGKERDANESDYHSPFERDLNAHLKNLSLPQIDYRPVESPQQRVKSMTIEAVRYYDQIGAAYRGGKGLSQVTEMAERQIAASIQNVVDFWLGAYQQAGHNFFEPSAQAFSAAAVTPDWSSKENDSEKIEKINVNSADKSKLAEFFNISAARAQKIVDARPFKSAYDLARVEGFTVHFVRRNKDRIKLQ